MCVYTHVYSILRIHPYVLQGLSHIGGRNIDLNLGTFIFLLFYCVVKIFSNAFLMEKSIECLISSG